VATVSKKSKEGGKCGASWRRTGSERRRNQQKTKMGEIPGKNATNRAKKDPFAENRVPGEKRKALKAPIPQKLGCGKSTG